MSNRYRFRCKPVSRANFRCCDNINCMLFLYEVVLSLIEREKQRGSIFVTTFSAFVPDSSLFTIYKYKRVYIKYSFFTLFYLRAKKKPIDLYQARKGQREITAYRCRYEGVNYLRRALIICFLSMWRSLMPLDRSEHCPLRTPTVAFVCPTGCPGTTRRGGVSHSRPARLSFNVMTIN